MTTSRERLDAVGRLGNFGLYQLPTLPYDRIVILRKHNAIVVGETAHLSYLMQMQYLNNKLRDEIDAMMAAMARRFGVDAPATQD